MKKQNELAHISRELKDSDSFIEKITIIVVFILTLMIFVFPLKILEMTKKTFHSAYAVKLERLDKKSVQANEICDLPYLIA